MANDEWRTPKELFDNLDGYVGGFNMDLCATHENALAPWYYTKDNSCIGKKWEGVCFCNPPYSDIPLFLKEIIGQIYGSDCEVWLLIPGNFEQYIHEFILNMKEWVESIYFIKGRLSYLNENNETVGSPRFASMLIHYNFGYDPIKFYTCERDFSNIKKIS